jgi:pyruvate/2-oxoglutarate dehydrogenase complex dihydrolipoamide dehydrogenase (E3) component
MNFLGGGSLEKIIIHVVLYLQSKVEKLIGHATITEDKCVQVEGQKYSAKHLLVATGGKPIVPSNIPGN